MGFVSIVRKLSTSLVCSLLGLLLVLMLFLHFWNLTPAGYVGAVMDDVFDHADTAAKEGFAQKVLSVCDKVGGSVGGALLGRTRSIVGKKAGDGVKVSDDALGLMIDICTKKETLAKAREECDWLKSYPTAERFPPGRDSMFDSVDDLRDACDAIESEDFEKNCKPLKAFGAEGQMGSILGALDEGCSKYNQGGSGEGAAKALIVGIAASAVGQDMGSVKALLPENVQDQRARRALSVIDAALTVFTLLKESLVLHIGAILGVIGIIALINIRHLDYAVKKISFSMIGPGISIILPYALIQLYLALAPIDTSPFFLALGGMTGFGQNIGGLVTSILPFLIVRTYTLGLIIATVALAVIGLAIRAAGLAALKVAEEETKEKGKEEKKDEEKEKKSLLSRMLPKRKKPDEKNDNPAEEKKEEQKPKEEPKIPKQKNEEKKPGPKKGK